MSNFWGALHILEGELRLLSHYEMNPKSFLSNFLGSFHFDTPSAAPFITLLQHPQNLVLTQFGHLDLGLNIPCLKSASVKRA